MVQLQLFAQSRSIYPSVPYEYQPKAENSDTLAEYFQKHKDPIKYLFASQFLLYFLSIIGTPFLILYLLYGFPVNVIKNVMEKEISSERKEDKPKIWEKKMLIRAVGVFSWIFWLYAVAMSSLAVYFQSEMLSKEFEDIHNTQSHPFTLLYGMTCLILTQNICTPIIYIVIYIHLMMIIVCIRKLRNKQDDYNFINIQEFAGILSLSLPITTLVVHFTHIVIGFIHNEYHATSVGFFYGAVVILHIIMFKILTHLYYSIIQDDYDDKNKDQTGGLTCSFVVIYCVSSIVLVLLVAFVAALYFLLPINNAFEDAPNRLHTFVSTLVLVFAAYIIFLLHKINKDEK